jgi:long-chain acyl-CoA synthetase
MPLQAFDVAESPSDTTGNMDLAGAGITAESVAEVVFTSGTTGAPKGVILSHGNIVANVRAVGEVIQARPSDRLLSILPLSHMLEQTVGLLLPLSGGGSVVYPASRQSNEIFRALARHGITAMVLVPQALQLFYDAIEREVRRSGHEARWAAALQAARGAPTPVRRLIFRQVHRRMGGRFRFFVCGGAPLSPARGERWETLGVPVLQGYGLTEAAPVVTGTAARDRRPDSVGAVLPGQSLRIAGDGEVLIAGPNVTAGYWRNPEATAAAFVDGWYRTGDLGEIDAAGFVRLKGRKKDMIVLPNGLNVYAEDVENALRQQPGVHDAAALGLADASGSTQVHAVLLGPATEAEAEDAVRSANTGLGEHQHVRAFSVWADVDFPRTPTLKVKKHEIVERIEGAAPRTQPVEEDPRDPLAVLVARLARRAQAEIRPESRLGSDLGLDSLGRIELLAAIESELGASMAEESVGEGTSLGELQALIAAAGPTAHTAVSSWPLNGGTRVARRALQDALAFPLLRLRCSPDVEGLEHVEALKLPAIFAPNHASHLDAPSVLAALPRSLRGRVCVAAADDYFFARRWLGLTVALLLNAFPFSRSGAVRPTLEHCGRLLDEVWSLVVFPEGTRSVDGRIAPFRPGIGLMSVELDVPIVPVRLRGTYESLPKGSRWPRAERVRVSFGEPLRFERGTSYAAATEAIEAAVRAL